MENVKTSPIQGIHHVTAMCGDPQTNIDFYTGVLGLRLVKLTVNYDDPGTYHLYYGDASGSPGTILTFFPWPESMPGQNGAGMATEIAFLAPSNSIGYWQNQLKETAALTTRFSDSTLTFSDPDGLRLAIVFSAPAQSDHALQGFHSVTLSEARPESTEQHLIHGMDFTQIAQEGNRTRFRAGGQHLDILHDPQAGRGRISAGAVHHLAWRVPDDNSQLKWQDRLLAEGRHVSPVMDRTYFHSIYWREPGGVLFEIATDPPGFTVDEPLASLGEKLILPRWLEPMRGELQRRLPNINIGTATGQGAAARTTNA